MTRLIARLVLAMLVLPLSGAVFVLLMGTFATKTGPPAPVEMALVWACVYAFVGIYWVLLWRDWVCWTPARKRRTGLAVVLAVAISVVVGALMHRVLNAPGFPAVLVSGGFAPIIWVLATVLIWRETPQERMDRIAAAGTEAVSCPVCGYNLTGLREASCPECGSRFTLDQLLAAQSHRDPGLPHDR